MHRDSFGLFAVERDLCICFEMVHGRCEDFWIFIPVLVASESVVQRFGEDAIEKYTAACATRS